ncbi:protein FAR1-RELATED SEQUENCE 5-like [Bidens hawaiensis]|uniref:protein FAR1-RELATED SEQUENCE 5-like n=1 Tax=Bidens hawaiensis TaxID=980011 RepID=UPI00404AC23A
MTCYLNVNTMQHLLQSRCVSSIVYHTPNGTTYWKPKVPEEFVPVKDMEFETWDDAVNMSNTYADKSGFSMRLSTIKRVKSSVTHRYMLCTRAGKPKFQDFDSINTNFASTSRRSSSKAVCCNARLRLKPVPNTMRFKIYDFVDIHTHELIGPNAMEFTKKRRKIGYSERNFIHKLSLNKIGPNIAHNLQCSLKGGSHNVNGTKTDFQNATRDVRLFISDRDTQMIVAKFLVRSTCQISRLQMIVDTKLLEVNSGIYFGLTMFQNATMMHSGRYGMIFVPFTGVDHHKKCVTFGAGLIYDETIESYKWLLDKFLKTHKKQPKLVLTDQDATVKQAVRAVFDQSIHRLCMWHIVKKIPLKVDFNAHDTTVSCSCMGFTRVGYLCRHAFCVFRYTQVELIPGKYLPARWMRNVLPDRVHDISNRYSAEDDEESVIRCNMFELLTECADRLRHKPDCLNSLLVQLKDIKDKVFKEFPSEPPYNSKRSIISELVGQPGTVDVTIKPPTGIRNKGSGTKRQVGVVEKLLKNCNKNPRLCHKCNKYVIDHDSRNCEKVKAAKEAAAAAAAVLADAAVAKSTTDRFVNRYATRSKRVAST